MILKTGVDIQNYLPHRAPLLMVDLILEIDANFVETIFLIKEDNIFIVIILMNVRKNKHSFSPLCTDQDMYLSTD